MVWNYDPFQIHDKYAVVYTAATHRPDQKKHRWRLPMVSFSLMKKNFLMFRYFYQKTIENYHISFRIDSICL